ncbi:MAG: hypothetical protein AAGI38_01830 [Bacteroidota bacterium]
MTYFFKSGKLIWWGCMWMYCSLGLFAQQSQGTRFWLSYMEHVDRLQNGKSLMITSDHRTSGRITIPGIKWQKGFSVVPGNVTVVELPREAETMGTETVQRTGILIESRRPVSVVAHQYANARSEAGLVLPQSELGRSYYVLAYQGYVERDTVYPSEFVIVAAYNQTEISFVTPCRTIGGRYAGERITVVLNKGETYQVQAAFPEGDFSGTSVRGNKPFALFAGAMWTQVPNSCRAPDNLFEQMYPFDWWGREYLAIPSENASYDYLRILARGDGTSLYQNGKFLRSLDAGEFVELKISGGAQYFEASQPVLVAQYLISNDCNDVANILFGDPSMILLSPLGRSSREIRFYSPPKQKISANYLSLFALTDDTASVRLDGQPIPGFKIVKGNPLYSWVRRRVVTGSHRIISGGCGVVGYCYGYGRLESYAFHAGFGQGFRLEEFSQLPDGGCFGDTLTFVTSFHPPYADVKWDIGIGTKFESPLLRHAYKNPGTYPISLQVHNLCLDTYDTLKGEVTVSPPVSIEVFPGDTALCAGSFLSLSAKASELEGQPSFFWSGPQGFVSEERNPRIHMQKDAQSGSYTVVAQAGNCYSRPGQVEVTIRQPKPDIGEDQRFCPGDTMTLRNKVKGNWNYSWQDGHKAESYQVLNGGTYILNVTDEFGCAGADTVEIVEKCRAEVFIPRLFTPNLDSLNDTFCPYIDQPVKNYSFQITSSKGRPMFQSDMPGHGWDGSLEGEPAEVGVYRWEVYFEDGVPGPKLPARRIRGKVRLMR